MKPPYRKVAWALGLAAAGLLIARTKRRPTFANQVVLITGGSRGLGLELARVFGREGARIALLARDQEELARAVALLADEGIEAAAYACDLTEHWRILTTVRAVVSDLGRIDVLVNNAGLIQVGPLDAMTREDFETAMDLHLYAPLELILSVRPYFHRQGGGRVVNISSIGGRIAVPHLLPYCVSKFALTGLSEGLRAELRRENIRVTTVCPGLMRTGSPPNALFKGQHRREYAWFAVSDSLPLLSMASRRAAEKIVAACRRGTPRLTLGIPAKLAVAANTLFPDTTARALALANRLLPDADGNRTAHLGRESESAWTQSVLTRPTQRAAARNNQEAVGGAV